MSTAVYSPPSVEDLAKEIRDHAPKWKLYQPGDKWFMFEHASHQYWMPPDLGGKEVRHPVTGRMVSADGILEIRGLYGTLRNRDGKKTGGQGSVEGADAIAIVTFAMASHGFRGVIWLRGDESDTARKSAARTLYRNNRKAWATGQIDARAELVENFKKLPTNANKRPPKPTDPQREAQALMDELNDEGSSAYEFVCEHGCSDFETFQEYARHMRVTHNTTVKEAIEEPPEEPERDEELPTAKRKPGRPKKSDA